MMSDFRIWIPSFLLILLLVSLPTIVFAKTIPAGFPPQSIWVSKTTATAGETLEIFTVVHNGSDTALKGAVIFSVNEKRIGTRDFNLDAGTSELVSIEWKTTAGEQKLSATIEDASAEGNGSIALSEQTSAIITVAIAEPPPSTIANAVNAASDIISETAKAATPVIQDALKTAYVKTEEFREQSIAQLEKYLGETSASAVLGASSTATTTLGSASSSIMGFTLPQTEAPSVLSKIKQTAAAATLFTLKSTAVFYPLLLFAMIAILYLLFRWAFKRPNF